MACKHASYNTDGDFFVTAYDEFIQGNLNNGGFVVETPSHIYLCYPRPYRINKETGNAELLCTVPTCIHNGSCISSDRIMQLQADGERIFGRLNIESNREINFIVEVKESDYEILYQATEHIHVPKIINGKLYVFSQKNGVSEYAIVDVTTKEIVERFLIDLHEEEKIQTALNMFFTNNTIYHSNLLNELIQIDIETGNVSLIASNIIKPQQSAGSIFFMRAVDDNDMNRGLFRMNMDGSGIALVNNNVSSFNIFNDTIYYTPTSFPRTLHAMSLLGENPREILDMEVEYIHILPLSNKLVFLSPNEDEIAFYSCNFDGNDLQLLPLPNMLQ